MYKLLVAGKVNFASGKVDSVWSNVLVLPDFEIDPTAAVSNSHIEQAKRRLKVRGRDLRGAVLIGAKLASADFTGATLEGANFSDADLKGSTFSFDCSGHKSGPDLYEGCGTDLREAIMEGAQLQGADLSRAQLEGANLRYAQLQGASLS